MITRPAATLISALALLLFAGPLAAQFETDALAAPPPASLLEAVKQSNLWRTRQLLEANPALVAERDENGETALHWAAVNGDTAIMRILILNKADVRARTRDGWTPLHVAAYQEQKRLAEILLIAGADRQAKDAKGLTPAHTLEERKRAILALLAPEGLPTPTSAVDTNALAALEREAAQWHAERAALMTDLAAARQEITTLKALPPPPPPPVPELDQLKSQLQAATARIAELDRQLESARGQTQAAETEAADARARLETAAAGHANQTQSLAAAQTRLADLQTRLDRAESQAAELQIQLEIVRNERAASTNTTAEIGRQLAETRQQLETATARAAEFQTRLEAAENERTASTNAAAEISRQLAETRQQLEVAEGQAAEIRRRLGAASADRALLEDDLAAAKAQAESLREQARTASTQKAELSKRLDAAEAETRKLRAALAAADSTRPEDLDRAIEEAAELEKKLQEERDANARLRAELDKARATPAAAPSSAPSSSATDMETMRRLLAVAHERIGELEAQASTAEEIKAEGERLRQRLEAMAGQNRSEASLIAAQDQLRAMRQKVGALEKALQDSYRVGQQLRKDADALRAERADLLARLAAAAPATPLSQAPAPASDARVRALEQSLAEVQAAVVQLRTQLRLASQERESLERQVRSLGGRPVTAR